MYSRRSGYSYRTYIRRKRLIVSIAVLAFAGGVVAVSIQAIGRLASATKNDHKELLRLWDAGSFDEVYNQSRASLGPRPLDYFLLTMHGFSAYQLGISQINSHNAARYFDDCVWALRKALLIKSSQKDGRLYYVLGKAYNYKGESYAELSVKYLEQAKALFYDAADIPEYLGLAYAAIGDYRSSVAYFAEALAAHSQGDGLTDVNPQGERPSSLLLLSIARSYVSLDEYELAGAYLQRCIDISPDSRTVLSARLMLSEVLQKAGDNEGARKPLLDILGETGENAEAHYLLGELYALQGEIVRARAEWRLAVRADPAHQKARTRLSM